MTDTLYEEPSWYSMIFRERTHDIRHYAQIAGGLGHSTRVLEYGVGTGRVAIPLARAGHSVLGIDRSASMIASFDERMDTEPAAVRARLSREIADARHFRRDERFELVICPFNGVGHYHDTSALNSFISAAIAHLEPGGTLAFDFIKAERSRLQGGVVDVPWLEDPRWKVPARCTETVSYNEETKILRVTTEVRPMKGDFPPRTLKLEIRIWSPAEVIELLTAHPNIDRSREVDLGDSHGFITRRTMG